MTILIIVSLLLGVSFSAAVENEPVVVSATGQNLRPAVAFNSQTEQFIIAWIHTDSVVEYEKAVVQSRLVSIEPEISLGPGIPISRPSGKKVYAPFVSVHFHPAQNRYILIWQETTETTRNLMLTTLDNSGEYIRRANRIIVKQGILISPPLIGSTVDNERILLIWNDLLQTGFRSQALTFNPDEPNNRDNLLIQLSGVSDLVQIPLDIVSRGDNSFSLYGFLLNTGNGANRNMFRRDIHLELGPEKDEHMVTRKKLRSSITLEAENGEDNDLILYNLNIPKKDLNALSVFPHPHDAVSATRPSADTSPSSAAFEGTLLAPAAVDGLAKLIWIEESEGIHSLIMQQVNADGDFTGEPMVIRQGKRPISFPVASWGAAQTEAMIAWCESMDDGTVQLLMTVVDLSQMIQQ